MAVINSIGFTDAEMVDLLMLIERQLDTDLDAEANERAWLLHDRITAARAGVFGYQKPPVQ